jgi:hypothetical protein
MRVIRRIAKVAIHHGLCKEGMGASVINEYSMEEKNI